MDNPLLETQLASETLYTGRVVRLEVDQVRLADGTESVREVIRHPGAVVIVGLLPDERVVLVKQFRYASGQALLELPAGTREAGEAPELTARRELAEETGYQSEQWTELATFYSAPGFCDELLHCYLAENLRPGGVGEADVDERIEPLLLPLAEARAMALRGEFHDAKTIAGLLLAADARPGAGG